MMHPGGFSARRSAGVCSELDRGFKVIFKGEVEYVS